MTTPPSSASVVHAARQARAMFAEMRERLGVVRDAYTAAHDQGQDRVTAGLAALRAAAERQSGGVAEDGKDSVKDRLAQIVGRGGPERAAGPDGPGRDIRDRLSEALGRVKPVAREETERGEVDEQDAAKAGAGRQFDRVAYRESLCDAY